MRPVEQSERPPSHPSSLWGTESGRAIRFPVFRCPNACCKFLSEAYVWALLSQHGDLGQATVMGSPRSGGTRSASTWFGRAGPICVLPTPFAAASGSTGADATGTLTQQVPRPLEGPVTADPLCKPSYGQGHA